MGHSEIPVKQSPQIAPIKRRDVALAGPFLAYGGNALGAQVQVQLTLVHAKPRSQTYQSGPEQSAQQRRQEHPPHLPSEDGKPAHGIQSAEWLLGISSG